MFECLARGLDGLLDSNNSLLHHVVGGRGQAHIQSVDQAELKGVHVQSPRQDVDLLLQREGHLIDAKATHGAAQDIVGVPGPSFQLEVGNVVRTGTEH